MEKIVEQGILYDFYGPLLTEHQRSVYESYVYDNLSLSEIAQEHNVSRQAVHDIIKRCDVILKGYEEKLGLVKRFNDSKVKLVELRNMLGSADENDGKLSNKNRMLDIVGTLLDEI